MGNRTYQFDPENSNPRAHSRSRWEVSKETLAKDVESKHHGPGGEKISYGKKFAKTEEMYAARRMNEELEELARKDGALDEEEQGEERGPVRQAIEDVTRGSPIGSLPTSSEPPPRDRFSELADDAQRYTAMIREAVKDITTAGFRLARLPVEAAILAARRFGPVRG